MAVAPRAATAPAVAALAAWGAGLIQIAIGAGAVTAVAQEGGAARGAGAALVAFGAAALTWGVVVLARARVLVPRIGVAGALAAIGAVASMLWIAPERTSLAAAAAAALLLLAVGFLCGHRLRQERVTSPDAAERRISTLAIVAAAVVVGAIVTPALGTTEVARLAPGHGTHEIVERGHH
jgi:hypothetical protein